MRIISKFNDYYDSAMGFGVDKRLIYLRHKSEELIFNDTFSLLSKSFRVKINGQEEHVLPSVIMFCGKVYPFLFFKMKYQEDFYTKERNVCFFNIDDYLNFIKKENPERYIFNNKKKASDNLFRIREVDILKRLSDVDACSFHFKYKSPIIMVSSPPIYSDYDANLVVNPTLKDYEFYKVWSSFQAFQEIDMYMSGVLGELGNETLTISDKEKMKKKGFYNYSFKTRPKK